MKKILFRSILIIILLFLGIRYFTSDANSDNQTFGVTIEGKVIDVVDMHMHTGTWEALTEPYKKRYSERVPKPFKFVIKYLLGNSTSSEGIIKQMNKAGIRRAGVFAVYSPDTTGIASNEFLNEQIRNYPDRMLGFASIRVDHWNLDSEYQLEKLEEDIGKYNVVGLKLAHAHQQIRLDDDRFDGIYEISGRLNKPIYVHTGTSPNPYTRLEPPYVDPKYLENSIRKYPNTQFILGHSGYDSATVSLTYLDSAIALVKRYDNVYLEPGALGASKAEKILPEYLKIIKENGLIGKVIYGSDGPQFPGYTKSHLDRFLTAMKDTGYTAEEIELLLQTNFEILFELQ